MARRPPKKKSGPRPPRQPRQPRVGKGNLQQRMMELQEQMLAAQEALKEEEVTASVGGGVVQVVVNGHQEMVSVTIDPEVVDPDDVEMLQDLILAAVNEALTKSRELASERMERFTGGLDVSGLI